MRQSLAAPVAVRPRLTSRVLLPALIAASLVGCGHRRQSMRPVFLSPAPASAGCPTTITPSGIDASPASMEPTMPDAVSPASTGPVTSSPSSLSPNRIRSLDSPPPVTGPAMPPGADEPGMELTPADKDGSKVAPLRNATPPATKGAGASSSSAPGSATDKGRRTATGRLRQASLREEVRPFVNDADNLFAPPKADRPWKYVVLHHSAAASGGYATIDREHRKRLGWDGCGYHFVIGNGTETPDGRIEVAQRWVNQKNGVHCRDGKTADVNEYGIGICLVGDIETSPPTDRQVAAARALVAYLGDRYQIPADHAETHSHLASSATSCPGKLFPTQAILGTRGLVVR